LESKTFRKWKSRLPHVHIPEAAYLLTSRLKPGQMEFNPSERAIVLKACLFWHMRSWNILAAVVMPDHFHLVGHIALEDVEKPMTIAQLAKSIKGYAAYEVNKLRGSHGSLWQRDYHDISLTGERSLRGALEYVVNNPVVGDLAEKPEDYPWLWTYWIQGANQRDRG